MKIRAVGAELLHQTGGYTDGRTDVTKPIVVFFAIVWARLITARMIFAYTRVSVNPVLFFSVWSD